jgi:hypothetical protein
MTAQERLALDADPDYDRWLRTVTTICAECGGPLAEYEIDRGYDYCGLCRGVDEDMLPGRMGR